MRRELVPLPGGALLVDTPGLRLVAPLDDGDEPVPLLDKAQVKRERRARERAFHRGIYREMRERKRDASEGRAAPGSVPMRPATITSRVSVPERPAVEVAEAARAAEARARSSLASRSVAV